MPRVRMAEMSVFSVTRSCSESSVTSRLLAVNTDKMWSLDRADLSMSHDSHYNLYKTNNYLTMSHCLLEVSLLCSLSSLATPASFMARYSASAAHFT